MFDPYAILSWATLLQALLFAAVFLAGRRRGEVADRLLVVLMLAVVIEKADQIFLMSGSVLDHPRLAMIGNTFGALIAPLTYLHLKARTQIQPRLVWSDSLAVLPFAVLVIYVLGTYHLLPLDEKIAAFRDGTILTPMNRLVLPIVGDLVGIAFLVAALRRLARHDAAIFHAFSDVEDRLFHGVRIILLIMAGIVVAHFVWTLTQTPGWGVGLSLGQFALVNALGLSLFARRAEPVGEAAYEAGTSVSADSREIAAQLERIDDAMRQQSLYLDPDLTLARLARAGRLKPRAVSEALNGGRGENFYTYVNRWRIEEAKRCLLADPDRSVLEIALACGFNSKSAFNTAFKRLALMTPSAWRRSQAS